MLLFKKKFLNQIRSGEKTQTIRLWKHRQMKPGQRSYIPGVGYILVTEVESVLLENLTDGDAVPDGFATAELLRQEIQALYEQKTGENLTPYRILFRVYPPEIQESMREEKTQEKKEEKTPLKTRLNIDLLHRDLLHRDLLREQFTDKTLEKIRRLAG